MTASTSRYRCGLHGEDFPVTWKGTGCLACEQDERRKRRAERDRRQAKRDDREWRSSWDTNRQPRHLDPDAVWPQPPSPDDVYEDVVIGHGPQDRETVRARVLRLWGNVSWSTRTAASGATAAGSGRAHRPCPRRQPARCRAAAYRRLVLPIAGRTGPRRPARLVRDGVVGMIASRLNQVSSNIAGTHGPVAARTAAPPRAAAATPVPPPCRRNPVTTATRGQGAREIVFACPAVLRSTGAPRTADQGSGPGAVTGATRCLGRDADACTNPGD